MRFLQKQKDFSRFYGKTIGFPQKVEEIYKIDLPLGFCWIQKVMWTADKSTDTYQNGLRIFSRRSCELVLHLTKQVTIIRSAVYNERDIASSRCS